VTGASGLIGSALTRALQLQEGEVTGFSRNSHGDYWADSAALARKFGRLKASDVVHLANPVPHNSYKSTREGLSQLTSVVEACILADAQLHFASTWAVFDSSTAPLASPRTAPSPHGLQAQAKVIQETFLGLQKYHGLSATTYRLPTIVDDLQRNPRFIRYLADSFASGTDISIHEFQNGTASIPLAQLRSCVEDFALAVLTSPQEIGLVHIATSSHRFDLAAVAARLALANGTQVIRRPIDRSVFTGRFVGSEDADATSNSDEDDLEWSLEIVKSFA
jgi:nucleoside-diphosphate-sugar epimerase